MESEPSIDYTRKQRPSTVGTYDSKMSTPNQRAKVLQKRFTAAQPPSANENLKTFLNFPEEKTDARNS